MGKYEHYVETGRPLDVHASFTNPLAWDRYQRGMRALASISVGEVAGLLEVEAGSRRVRSKREVVGVYG